MSFLFSFFVTLVVLRLHYCYYYSCHYIRKVLIKSPLSLEINKLILFVFISDNLSFKMNFTSLSLSLSRINELITAQPVNEYLPFAFSLFLGGGGAEDA